MCEDVIDIDIHILLSGHIHKTPGIEQWMTKRVFVISFGYEGLYLMHSKPTAYIDIRIGMTLIMLSI